MVFDRFIGSKPTRWLLFLRLPGVWAVSYTHLDVYKRQAQAREGTQLVLQQLGKLLPPSARLDLFDPEVVLSMLNQEPVSYTHLDVYKRQARTVNQRGRKT